MNPVIVTEIIEPADYMEMTFNNFFVKTVDIFELKKDYVFTNFEIPVDEGRMSRLDINTEQFARIDSLEVRRNGSL